MTIRNRILAACAVTAVLTTAVTTQALAQPLLSGASASATSPAAAEPAAATTAVADEAAASTDAAVRASALADLSDTLAVLLNNEASDYSIAAYDSATGIAYSDGSTGGMYTASIVKVEILAALLLQHQDAGTELTSAQLSLATAMIEQSDNDAASALWTAIGGEDGLDAASSRLGLTSTVGGENGYWGLTSTSAADQVALLGALINTDSALTAASQSTLLSLMGSVSSDQYWGVSSAADTGTATALKNGWLSLSADDGLWVVNSIGLVTVDGSTIQIAVMLRGLGDFATGVTLAGNLAAATADALAALRDQPALSAT
ncbi:MAG: hypothetical protein JWN61_1316 [Pseudonocardiales bacterium]|nr:hypothetical protein [Pseudonocardiales bacterium]